MACADLTVYDHFLNLVMKLQQTHCVGDLRTALGDPLSQLVLCKLIFFDQAAVSFRFFNGIQIFSLNVFDQGDLCDLFIRIFLDHNRNFL